MDAKEIIKDAKRRMDGAISAFHDELVKIRTGRATPNLLDGVKVEYYGQKVPLNQVATITAPEPRLIVIQPWEKKMLAEIEKEILKADLGFNPSNDGNVIRIPIPPLSEERRKDLVKLVHKFAEDARIAVRNVRRDANDHLKKLEKDHQISEDELSVYLDEVQELTDDHIKKIDEMMHRVRMEKQIEELTEEIHIDDLNGMLQLLEDESTENLEMETGLIELIERILHLDLSSVLEELE